MSQCNECKCCCSNKENSEEHMPSVGYVMPDLSKVFVSRDEFLKLVGVVLSGLMALIVAIPGLGFVFSYLFVPRPRAWTAVGSTDKFKDGETVDVVFEDPYSLPWDGVTSRRSAWLRRINEQSFQAFAIECTHLGCPLRWEKGAALFMCPCHGGVFYSNGDVAGGPPPRAMHQYPVRVRDGQVEISVGPVLSETTNERT